MLEIRGVIRAERKLEVGVILSQPVGEPLYGVGARIGERNLPCPGFPTRAAAIAEPTPRRPTMRHAAPDDVAAGARGGANKAFAIEHVADS